MIDAAVGAAVAAAAKGLGAHTGVGAGATTAVGSHGQTIIHEAAAPRPCCLQVGNPDTIAAPTGIEMVADFPPRGHRGRRPPWMRMPAGRPQGDVDEALPAVLLSVPCFVAHPPECTGTAWRAMAEARAPQYGLTARSVAEAVRLHSRDTARLLVCGRGAHNSQLMRRLAAYLPAMTVESTARPGIDPDWLVQQVLAGEQGNIAALTRARHAVPLGWIVRYRTDAIPTAGGCPVSALRP